MEIDGLTYLANYLNNQQQAELWQIIYQQPWLSDLKRRTQHYGYKYDYKARKVDFSMYLGALPNWVQNLASRLYQEGFLYHIPDQAIINEYEAGQGISKHIDCRDCFTDGIASISLGSPCTIDFTRPRINGNKSIWLTPGSLLVIKGEARYKWAHAIAARKSDLVNGARVSRSLRVSITFRKTIIAE